MVSGQFSYNAMEALTEKYGAQIESVECDQMVSTVSTRLYCRTTMVMTASLLQALSPLDPFE